MRPIHKHKHKVREVPKFMGTEPSPITPYRPYRNTLYVNGRKHGRPRASKDKIEFRPHCNINKEWKKYFEFLLTDKTIGETIEMLLSFHHDNS